MLTLLLISLGLGMMPSMMSSGGRQDPPGHTGFGSDYLSGESEGACEIYLASHADVCRLRSAFALSYIEVAVPPGGQCLSKNNLC